MKENEVTSDSNGGSVQIYEMDERRRWEQRYIYMYDDYITFSKTVIECN